MKKEEALEFVKNERLKEIEEFAKQLELLAKEYDVSLEIEVAINPNGTVKRIIILDNKRLV